MTVKIVQKYKDLPIQVKASLCFFVCSFLQKGISFITTPIFTRLLSTSEYGKYSIFSSWQGVLSVIVTLHLSHGVYTRGLVKFEKEKEVFSSSLQGLTLTLVSVWLLFYLVFQKWINSFVGLATNQFVMMFLIIWASSVFYFWSTKQRVELKYQTLVLVTIAVSIAKPVLGILLVRSAEDKVTARIFGLTLVEILAFTPLFFLQMRRGKCFYNAGYWKHAIKFNLPLIPHYLSQTVLSSMDRIMVGRMVDNSTAGIYSLAYSISMIMTMFNSALFQTYEPWLYKKIHRNEIESISKAVYPSFLLIAIVNLLLIAFAPEVVAIFAPPAYHDAIYVIPPVAMSVFFMFAYPFFAVFEFYFEKTKWIAAASVAGAVLNIILNFIFIRIFGYYAAGYTTLVCYIIYAASHYMFMRKICKNHLNNRQPYNMKIFILLSFVFIAVGFIILLTYSYPYVRYGFIICIVVESICFRKKLINTVQKILNIRKESKDS